MTTTFLGFFMNRSNREEFVAPVVAADIVMARGELLRAYPESRYALLTIYSRPEVQHILQGIDRWPGLPSKVQEPLRTDLSKVTASTGGLPPLPGQVQATVQPVEAIAQNTLPSWMQSLVTVRAPLHDPSVEPVSRQPVAQKAAPALTPMQSMMAQPKTSLPPQSLIERLKAARGETMQQPVRREATAAPDVAAAITRNASGASVIDILKSMRK